MCLEATPAAKEKWRHLKTGQIARIMTFTENWIVARYKGSAPWCQHWNDFKKNYERVIK